MSTEFSAAVARVRAGADAATEARALVAAMTLEEQLGCLDGDTPFWEGLIDMLSGGYYEHPYPAAVVPRLGIPGLQFSDGPRGVVVGQATAFPVSMARGATFDPALEERVGDAIGRELRAAGATFYGGVCVNLLRHPAWGRAQETYGEDPYLLGEMGSALVRGVQRHAMACVKHFACNSMENARFTVDVTADERALHEVYLPHFRRIVAAGVASVMSAYNSLNGEWCGQHPELLTRILRDEWGFDGYVISDFQFGLRDAVASVRAGLDIEMPFMQQRWQHLPTAVADGTLARSDVERVVERILTTFLRFAHVFDGHGDRAVLACDAHRALSREVATRSIVLLRNEHDTLPLAPSQLRRLAVIGSLATTANIGDGGSSNVHPPHIVTPLDGLRAALPGVEIVHHDGVEVAAAGDVAASADAAIVVVGYTKEDEGEFVDNAGVAHLFHLFPPMTDATIVERLQAAMRGAAGGLGMSPGGDRATTTLRESHEQLIEQVAARNPRSIVVVMGGSAVVMERWRTRVPAIVLLWYPGMEGGHALADILLGHANPSGRLPFAIPTDAAHWPAFDRTASTATYDLWHGQWKLARDGHDAAYPFGFGLSYAPCAIDAATITGSGPRHTVRATVRNPATRAGSEVVQVYGGLPSSRYERPMQRLLGFARVEVSANATSMVEIPITLETLSVRDRGTWQLEPGTYTLWVARHAHDPHARQLMVTIP